MKYPLILASSSPARLALLTHIGVTPDFIIPANIDETELKGEIARQTVIRLAEMKASKVASEIHDGIILSADTIVSVGRTQLPKATNDDLVAYCLNKLSGKRHTVFTGLCILKKINNLVIDSSIKLVSSKVKFKRFNSKELARYIESGEGINKAGGYSIGGYAESFIEFLSGSHSNVIGLPLYETRLMLEGLGYGES